MASRSPGGPSGLIARWSARKEAARRGEAIGHDSADAPPKIGPSMTELTDADMPPLETLTETSDYSGFLSPKVSEALRQAALDRLFRSAGLNFADGLDDYAEDYTQFKPLGDVLTADLRHHLEQEARRLLDGTDSPKSPETPEVMGVQTSAGTVPELAGPERTDAGDTG